MARYPTHLSKGAACALHGAELSMSVAQGSTMTATRVEHDSLGPVNVPGDKLWGAQTQRSLEHFSIGDDLIPRELIDAYAVLKKAAATANHRSGRLTDE